MYLHLGLRCKGSIWLFLPSLWVRESHILETLSSGWREESPFFYVWDACNSSHYCDSNHDTTNVTLTMMTLTKHGKSSTHTQYISLRWWKMSALLKMCSASTCVLPCAVVFIYFILIGYSPVWNLTNISPLDLRFILFIARTILKLTIFFLCIVSNCACQHSWDSIFSVLCAFMWIVIVLHLWPSPDVTGTP